MAHPLQRDFLTSVRSRFPDRFISVRVFDIGSLDINGNNRWLFTLSEIIGIDLGPGPNVDVCGRAHEYESDSPFDVVISSECFEHDEYWPLTIQRGIDLLKPGGLFLFTCATTGRMEHGTKRCSPGDSPFTSQLESDWYQNLGVGDIIKAIDMNQFSNYSFEVRQEPNELEDLYFWGLKRF